MSTEFATPESEDPIRSAVPAATHLLPAPISETSHGGGVLVQKFGGSSIADAAGLKRAAERISRAVDAGFQVVAVVSAMGDTTDELCDLAADLSPSPHPSNLDALLSIGELVSSALLAIALAELGRSPRTFTGSQAGLITDSVHGKARITDVRCRRVRASLDAGEVPIVAGFQGRSRKGKVVTTLGRGGSDLTAVALAAALGAGTCEIYTDVDGVFTADPRIVPTARKINDLTSEEMLELAASGCKVLHARCVGYARRFGVPIRVRSSFSEDPGTLIVPDLDPQPFGKSVRERPVVTRISAVNSAVRMTVAGLPDGRDGVAGVFDVLARSGVTVETVRKTPRSDSGRSDVALVVPSSHGAVAVAVLRTAQAAMGFEDLHHDGSVGRVSISGVGMRSSPEVLCTFLNALSGGGIACDLVEVSETGIAGIIRAERLVDAEGAVRRAFGAATDGDSGAARRSPVATPAAPTPTGNDWAPAPLRELVSAGSVPSVPAQAALP
jgi:aspartate kinase